jgi:plasmid stabilization system protein ParE
MKVRYTLRARADLEAIYEYLEKQQHTAAQRLRSAIERQIGWLIHFPYMAPDDR